jgi:DNA polymerase-1
MRVRVPIRRRSAFPSIDGVFIADTAEKCQQALRMIADWPVVGVDTEAYGADLRTQSPVYHVQPVSIQFAGATGKQIFVPLWDRYRPLLDVFKGFLAEEQERKVLHNAKFDMHVLENAGAPMRGILGDTLVMHYLYYNGEQFHGLKEAVKQIFNEETVEYSDTFRKPVLKKNGEPSVRTYVPSLIDVIKEPNGVETLVRYSVKDPWYTVRLFQHLEEKLRATAWTKRGSYYDYYRQFELPYTTVLYNMERRGCLIDMPYLEKAKTSAEKKI